MSKRDPALLINDILESCNKILQYTSSMNFEEFLKDSKTIDAVIRNFEIIGEALSRILTKDPETNISNSRKIVDTRNRIIHGYDAVSDEIIWGIVIKHIPVLQKEVHALLGD
ncbi:MAG: DUF86 domain-containing protein [Sphingomonadales bacterium]|nr:DUF86 domain-containing protein [Sphingomonadales bacterium]